VPTAEYVLSLWQPGMYCVTADQYANSDIAFKNDLWTTTSSTTGTSWTNNSIIFMTNRLLHCPKVENCFIHIVDTSFITMVAWAWTAPALNSGFQIQAGPWMYVHISFRVLPCDWPNHHSESYRMCNRLNETENLTNRYN